MQIKTLKIYHYIPIKMDTLQRLTPVTRNVKQLELLYTAVGMRNGIDTLENSLAASYNVKHIIIIRQ